MSKSKQAEDARRRTVEVIRKTFESLDTHLDPSVRHRTLKERGPTSLDGTRKFHADTVREYASMILELAKNL